MVMTVYERENCVAVEVPNNQSELRDYVNVRSLNIKDGYYYYQ